MRGLTFIYYSPVFLAQYAMPLVCDHLKEGVRVNLIEVGDTGFLVPIPGNVRRGNFVIYFWERGYFVLQ